MAQWYCYVGGQRYGPVDEQVLRQWIAEGRLGASDKVWTEGMAEWQVPGTTPQLGGIAPVAAQATSFAPLAPQVPNAPGATAALVCGIIAMATPCAGIIFAIIAIVLAQKAREALRTFPGYYGGESMATAGRVLGIIALVLGILQIVGFVFMSFFRAVTETAAL